ncbi:hypothetical protein J6590_088870 [Homalodisca vitripennis]|nr:hypothetical protein J6590_093669 [Homalodisca vitripennis]KAG8270140.1 hypothetical protein J6590_091614 [Homalodisca vitripennis]KAG8290173.1 hypothetical protein J6590_088870 [Homalodisca vitripennis]
MRQEPRLVLPPSLHFHSFSAPTRSIDSTQSRPHSHLPNYHYYLLPTMGEDNYSELTTATVNIRREPQLDKLNLWPKSLLSDLRKSDRGQPYEDLKNTPTQAHEVAAQTEELLNTNEEPCQHCVIRNEEARNMMQTIRTLEEEHPLFNPTTSEEVGVQCDLPIQLTAGTCERVDLLDSMRTTIEVLEAKNQSLKLQEQQVDRSKKRKPKYPVSVKNELSSQRLSWRGKRLLVGMIVASMTSHSRIIDDEQP